VFFDGGGHFAAGLDLSQHLIGKAAPERLFE
jgi:hypothetical protein